MADNDPAALQPEVDPRLVRPDESQHAEVSAEIMPADGEAREERPSNTSSAEEPKMDASASEPVSTLSGVEEGTAVPLSEQTTSPRPPGDGVPNTEERPTESAPETVSSAAPAMTVPTPAKRFTSMNINKKFLAKTAAASPSSSSSTAAPKMPTSTSTTRLAMPNPATPSKLVTKKLTVATPTPTASGGWSLRATPPASLSSSPAPGDAPAAQPLPSVKPPGPADALKRPTLVSSTSALSTDPRPSAVTSRDQSPVKAWALVPAPAGDPGRNLRDFPTAAEAAADHSEATAGISGSHSDQIVPPVPSDSVTRRSLLSPSHQAGTLPTIPSPSLATAPTTPDGPSEASALPIVPAALNDEREKYMKQAAERARRRKQEEETAREEARERARKKAAELEALSKASLVSASPLVALTRKASATGLSSGAKSPVPKSPSVSPAALPTSSVASEEPGKPKEILEPPTGAATLSSWRTKPKPEPAAALAAPEAPQPVVASAQHEPVQRPPPTVKLGHSEGIGPIEELGQADGPVEVMDFSDMGKLTERRTSVTSGPDLTRSRRVASDDFLDEAPPSRRLSQTQPSFTHWNRDTRNERTVGDHSEDRPRAPSVSFNKHPPAQNRLSQEGTGTKPSMSAPPNQSSLPQRSSFKEAPISALDDVMSRIKGVLTGMHADNEKPAAGASQPPAPSISSPAPSTTTSAAHAPTRPNIGTATRWKGDGGANWRDGSNKRPLNGPLPEAQPTEPFAITRPERPDSPPPAWKTYAVHLNKSNVARPPMPKKQAALAKLPPMPVRWDILTWDPPVERMSTRTLSRDDTFFPKITIRGVLSARVHLPSSESNSEAQSAKQNESPAQRTRLTLAVGPDPKPARSPNLSARPPPKGPAFSETQWRKPHVTSPLRNTLELHNHIAPAPVDPAEETQLETTSRSPPPQHTALSQVTNSMAVNATTSGPNRVTPKQSRDTDVTFHHSLNEKRPSAMPSVSFTVSSELDEFSTSELKEEGSALGLDMATKLEDDARPAVEDETAEPGLSGKVNGDAGEKGEQVAVGDTSMDKVWHYDIGVEAPINLFQATQSATPNSSVIQTPPAKATPPWQSSNPRLPDADFIKSVWQHASPKDGTATENSLRGLADDFPSSIPHSVQEMKADEVKPNRESTSALQPGRVPHNAHRAFQQVPTSPVPMHILNYPNANHLSPGQAGPSRPMPMSSFSLPPPAPPQVTAQPSPFAPYVHPTPPNLMYAIPPSRIAPSPAPGGPQMWMQNQGYGRPSPPTGMYPGQPGHNIPYVPPVPQLPPSMSKPQVTINGNHGHHHMSNPGMPHPMHMTSPAMSHVGHMGSPALAHATPHMPGGPQHMYPGMGSPGGMGMGGNMPYGAQRPAAMMQQSPMQAPLPNGYGMSPSGSFGPNGYGRPNVRSPADGMPHHMTVPHPQHAPMSPGTYHPAANGYVRA
ncbi:hypothetical protein FRC07_001421 [Ceratobasidium sp. 392]|nr:hypothetical protein FRC07_001421 [Ceratobasidium sp. 392]